MKSKMAILSLLIGLLLTSSGLATNPDMVGWWLLDEGEGDVVKDKSGNGNDGTIDNASGGSWVEDAVRGNVLSSSGGGGGLIVRAGELPVMTMENDFTWAFWANQDPALSALNHIVVGNRRSADDAEFSPRQFIKFTPTKFEWHMNGANAGTLDYDDMVAGEWTHHAMVKTADQLAYYRNGVADVTGAISAGGTEKYPVFFFGDGKRGSENWMGMLSDVRLFTIALTPEQVEAVVAGKGAEQVTASAPVPGDEESDVLRDGIVLSWTPGVYAQTHDVYIGKNFGDVNDATVGSPLSTDVHAGLSETTLPLGRLAFDATYYWRVDEVNAPSAPAVYKGKVWSFTVEAEALDVEGVTVSASSRFSDTEGADNTVNGSGLVDGAHSTDRNDMWLSEGMNLGADWIAFDLQKTHTLASMRIWNHNTQNEFVLGYGIKTALIEYSLDGENWIELKTVELPKASALADYAGSTVPLDGIQARFVRITGKENWSELPMITQVGLGEVRFGAIPTAAREPNPADGAAEVSVQTALSWRAGRVAAQHEVRLGTDPNAMTLVDTVDVPTYEPMLDLDQTYYWQIDEVNTAEVPDVHAGPKWSFSTEPYITIDNFESYTDTWGSVVFQSWLDGLGWEDDQGTVVEGNGSGAIVGYWPAPTIETSIAYDGGQSMPLTYGDGDVSPSKATRTFAKALPGNKHGIQSLSLQFYGAADNVAGQLFVEINGKKLADYPGPQTDLLEAQWHAWPIDLSGSGIADISSLSVGVTGGKGQLFIDAIRLYPKAGETVTPVEPDATGLVAYYALDGDATDATGGHNGTASGDPTYAAGKQGQALSITGEQYITVPYAETLSLNTFTLSVWVKITDIAGNRGVLGTRFNGNHTFDLKVNQGQIHGDIGDGSAWLNTALDIKATAEADTWYHIVYVIDDVTDTAKLYLNGLLGGSASFDGTPLFMKADQELRIGNSYGTEYMNGLIDEVVLYNRVLNAEEVAGLSGRTGLIYKPF